MINDLEAKITNLFKSSFIYGLGSIAQSGLNFILIPIMTLFLTQEEFGVYSLIMMSGLGITEKYLAQKGLEVSAQEFSKSSEFWSDEVKYISSLDGLKFESFDLVYEVSTLYNFSDKDLEKYLFKLTNLLKKGGYLIIYEQECRSLLGIFI